MAGDTPLRSIEVGTEDMGTAVGACDGFPCTFFDALAWRDDTSPLPVGINPRVTFERMFGETGSTEQRAARLKEKQSLLDSVTQETAKLRRTLGAPDRAILDEYLSNIRQVEQQLDRMESRLGTITGNPEAPVGLPEAFDDHMTVTYNLMHLALAGRHQPRLHVHDRPRGERPRLRPHRHPRDAPQHLAPRQRRREAGEVRRRSAPTRSSSSPSSSRS